MNIIKRIDRIISEQTNYSRKEIKKLISKGLIYVNDQQVKKPECKFEENDIVLKIEGKEIDIKDHIYLILNKPKGFVSTTDDVKENSVLNLVPLKYKKRNLFPAGRLDKDTTGLMIITDDGGFAHNILAPNKHVKKIYEVKIDIPVSSIMKEEFAKGVILNDGVCKSAELNIKEKYRAEVILTEGRYHQIKRMFACFKAKVIELNRIGIGDLYLPKDLKIGDVREVTKNELLKIQEK